MRERQARDIEKQEKERDYGRVVRGGKAVLSDMIRRLFM